MEILNYILIFLGSTLMVFNIIRYILFIRYLKKLEDHHKELRLIYVPLVLLCMFLAGYLLVGFFLKPEILVAGILFGGSVFVFLILMLMWSITDRIRQTQQLHADLMAAEEASKSKTAFLSNMSHDIRTPLNAILGYAHLAHQQDITLDEMKEYLGKIEGSGQHLLALINDVLEMSRIESGKMELDMSAADLREIMKEIRDIFELQMQSKGIHYQVTCEKLEHPTVFCDKKRINRILLNLVSNAYKFTPEGGSVNVLLRQTGFFRAGTYEPGECGCNRYDKCRYEFHVKDTGIGMSEEFKSRIFNAFERERTATVSGIQGTGLGMAITKKFVDMMYGRIDVFTQEGEGTEFVVTVDLRICSEGLDPDTGKCLCEAESDAVDFNGRRILLAEDMEVNREIATMLLENMGFNVDCAVNGKEALEKVKGSHPGYYDVILMDVQMPVMDGYEASRKIRSLSDPGLANIPIIAATANAFHEDKQRALDAGMNDHIAKPIDPKAMRATLAEVLSK